MCLCAALRLFRQWGAVVGFSVKLAPGIRIRASSRGIGASVGPRAARLHVGSGRAGFSSGMGPVSMYTSLNGGSRRASRPSMSSYERQVVAAQRRADKAAEADRLADELRRLTNVHREEFPPASRPVVPLVTVDRLAVHRRASREAVAGLSVFRRSARAQARRAAAVRADEQIAEASGAARAQRLEQQARVDQIWEALVDNDPNVVPAVLAAAFGDNEATAAVVGMAGSEVSLVMLAPDESVVPERLPSLTDAGNLSLRKLPKADRSAIYLEVVLGHLLVTLREVFAVAPALTAARVVVLRRAASNAYGQPGVDPIVAGRWEKAAFDGVHWSSASAVTIARDTASELVLNQGRTLELRPLPLTAHPDLANLIGRVDIEDLLE